MEHVVTEKSEFLRAVEEQAANTGGKGLPDTLSELTIDLFTLNVLKAP